jgi:hypothetical protein
MSALLGPHDVPVQTGITSQPTEGAQLPRTDADRLPALLSVPRVAELLGISRASAYRYASAGELPTKRLGGRVYIVTARLRDLLDGQAEVAA